METSREKEKLKSKKYYKRKSDCVGGRKKKVFIRIPG
jgi:hypothetical protein